MAFRVVITTGIVVELSGLDRLLKGRRRIEFEATSIAAVDVRRRSDLEATVDHRASGIGTHDGATRPDRRRLGTMYGRGVSGKQFGAVAASPGSLPVLVLDLDGHEMARAVLQVDDPQAAATAITSLMT